MLTKWWYILFCAPWLHAPSPNFLSSLKHKISQNSVGRNHTLEHMYLSWCYVIREAGWWYLESHPNIQRIMSCILQEICWKSKLVFRYIYVSNTLCFLCFYTIHFLFVFGRGPLLFTWNPQRGTCGGARAVSARRGRPWVGGKARTRMESRRRY